eukprot:CAMPEP_0197047710 /NCGR_PEP_ID=MMETSP1384-20130603/23167_1 /TAXON_ID=29189 /ORGANISM="Ammonia sp." /LENGTH=281 /DNA_ID=CAMNT_0042479693 /DNA_START=229 /DNA_END=1074 /DNA_ORIENTATION=+
MVLLRLYWTFEGSAFALSSRSKLAFLFLYILTVLTIIASTLIYIINNSAQLQVPKVQHLMSALGMLGVLLYLAIGIGANYIFTKNLIDLASLTSTSLHRVVVPKPQKETKKGYMRTFAEPPPDIDEEFEEVDEAENGIWDKRNFTIMLSDDQTKLIQNITKYVSVFSIAILTSLLTVGTAIVGEVKQWQSNQFVAFLLMSTVDSTVNVLCLYLQYPFNSKRYVTLCVLSDWCWKRAIITWTKNNIRESLHNRKLSSIQAEPAGSVVSQTQLTQNADTVENM